MIGVFEWLHVCVRVFVCVCVVCPRAYVCVCVRACMWLYINIVYYKTNCLFRIK